jgi:hypothetical protein
MPDFFEQESTFLLNAGIRMLTVDRVKVHPYRTFFAAKHLVDVRASAAQAWDILALPQRSRTTGRNIALVNL